jgi:hypothetical protein
VFGPCA